MPMQGIQESERQWIMTVNQPRKAWETLLGLRITKANRENNGVGPKKSR